MSPSPLTLQANTERHEYVSEGMYHNEGGWRPDVNPTDSNQLMRWRRKIEKDDHYVTQMVKISNVSIAGLCHGEVSI